MAGTLTITGKTLGSRTRLFADFSIPAPPENEGDGSRTLRQLIDRVVRHEVAAFRKRQRERHFVRVLTRDQIDESAERGRVNPAARSLEQAVDEDDAVGAALQAFEDGLYLVVIDEQDCRSLDEAVHLRPDSTMTFVRLVFLAGA